EALIEPPVVVPATNALSTVVIVPHSGPLVSVEDYEYPDLVDVCRIPLTLHFIQSITKSELEMRKKELFMSCLERETRERIEREKRKDIIRYF
ncbi:hypothetical protein Tco_0574676, partial [Tanacetum coccineum]